MPENRIKNLIPSRFSRLNGVSERLVDYWFLLRKNRVGFVGFCIVVLYVFLAVFADVIAPVSPWHLGSVPFMPPFTSFSHILGTDNLGRDIFSGVVHGARVSLLVGIVTAFFATLIGIGVGSVSGYYGGKTDDALMRMTDFFMVFPAFVLALVLTAYFTPSIWNIILVLTIATIPPVIRLTRAEFLRLKESSFVEVLRAQGAKDRTIMFEEILPNAFPPLIINGALLVGRAILLEAGLSYFGLGDPSQISWGYMLQNASGFLTQAFGLALFPGLALSTLVLGINLFGDSLNDVLNPRTKQLDLGAMPEKGVKEIELEIGEQEA